MADLARTITVQIVVNWGGGTLQDTSFYNDVSAYWLPGSSISIIRGRTEADSTAPPTTERLEFTLNNYDGRFSNNGGPLEGLVTRGPEVVVYLTWDGNVDYDDEDVDFNDDTIPYDGRIQLPIFTGNIDTARQSIDGLSTVQISCLGKYSEMSAKRVTVGLLEDTTVGTILTALATAIGIPSSRQDFEEGSVNIDYFWAGDNKPVEFIPQLVAAEGANAVYHVDGAGVHHFENRNHRDLALRSSEVQWYVYDKLQTTDPPAGRPIYHSPPTVINDQLDTIRNLVIGETNYRVPATLVTQVWSFGAQLDIPSGASRTIYAVFDEPVKDAVVPVVTTDFQVTGGISLITLGATGGTRIPITIVANAFGASIIGPTGQESDGIYLRAKPITRRYSVELQNTEDTTLSKNRYREIEHKVNIWPEINSNSLQDNVNVIAAAYKDGRDQITIRVFAYDYAHILFIIMCEISDRIHIKSTRGGLDHDFFIETKQIVIEGNNNMWCILGCERAIVQTSDTLRFGDTEDFSKIGTTKLGG